MILVRVSGPTFWREKLIGFCGIVVCSNDATINTESGWSSERKKDLSRHTPNRDGSVAVYLKQALAIATDNVSMEC
jgi:hypothetical protein